MEGGRRRRSGTLVRVATASLQRLIELARDSQRGVQERVGDLRSLMRLDPSAGKDVLLSIANDETESDDMLGAVGAWLADLAAVYVVSEFDTRDLTDRAAEAFFGAE
jgi:hypothetical protein